MSDWLRRFVGARMHDEDPVDDLSGSNAFGLAPSLAISPEPSAWTITAYSKKTLKGWAALCERLPQNATRCYEWLRLNPVTPIPRRCYELKHKNYAGCWCYEIGSGDRIYYKPRRDRNDVLVYYAGPHPVKVPSPPRDL